MLKDKMNEIGKGLFAVFGITAVFVLAACGGGSQSVNTDSKQAIKYAAVNEQIGVSDSRLSNIYWVDGKKELVGILEKKEPNTGEFKINGIGHMTEGGDYVEYLFDSSGRVVTIKGHDGSRINLTYQSDSDVQIEIVDSRNNVLVSATSQLDPKVLIEIQGLFKQLNQNSSPTVSGQGNGLLVAATNNNAVYTTWDLWAMQMAGLVLNGVGCVASVAAVSTGVLSPLGVMGAAYSCTSFMTTAAALSTGSEKLELVSNIMNSAGCAFDKTGASCLASLSDQVYLSAGDIINVSAVATSSGVVMLNWEGSVERYRIYYSVYPDETASTLLADNIYGAGYLHVSLDPGKKYFYKIKAIGPQGQDLSGITKVVNVTVPASAVPPASASISDAFVLEVYTGATVDLGLVEQGLQQAVYPLGSTVTVANGIASWSWNAESLFSRPGFFDVRFGEALDLSIEASISADGVMRFVTKDPHPEHHLAILTAGSGAWNYHALPIGTLLPPGEYDFSPEHWLVTKSFARRGLLAWFAVQLYSGLYASGAILSGPVNTADLWKVDWQFYNGFNEQLTVMNSYLWHHQMDYAWYNEYLRPIHELANRLWSPIAKTPDQNATLSRAFDVDYLNASSIAVSMYVGGDNGNISNARVIGISGYPGFFESTSGWELDCVVGSASCSVSTTGVSDSLHVTVFGQYPDRVEMDLSTTWSVTQASVGIAVFGDVSSRNNEETPQPGDDANPLPMKWVVPAGGLVN